eukprot:scaffold1298_cov382-Prasinococcus_capsulatus_cf.AAC.4
MTRAPLRGHSTLLHPSSTRHPRGCYVHRGFQWAKPRRRCVTCAQQSRAAVDTGGPSPLSFGVLTDIQFANKEHRINHEGRELYFRSV